MLLTPVPGLYDWVFSFDMNSLYPTTMRSLNLSPECIVGQINLTLTKTLSFIERLRKMVYGKKLMKEYLIGVKHGLVMDVWGTLEYQEVYGSI